MALTSFAGVPDFSDRDLAIEGRLQLRLQQVGLRPVSSYVTGGGSSMRAYKVVSRHLQARTTQDTARTRKRQVRTNIG